MKIMSNFDVLSYDTRRDLMEVNMGLLNWLGAKPRKSSSGYDQRFSRWGESEQNELRGVLQVLPPSEPELWNAFLARVKEVRSGYEPTVSEGDVERVLVKIGLHVMLDFSGKSGGFRVRVEFDPASRNFGILTVETFVGTLQGVLVACRQVTDPGILRLQYFIEHGEAQKADILALFKDS